jgi:lysophospholipase L1-like esterase
MGWEEVNLGRGGTGYVTSSNAAGCGLQYCPTFVEMAEPAIATNPDIVVISGGQNDGTKVVRSAASKLFAALRKALPNARIYVISPLWRSTQIPASLQQISAEVKAAAAATGVTYVEVGNPLQDQPELFSADGTHPTAAGYKKLATAITAAIRKS